MIKDLRIKAKEEKYFKSIRYFSHNLPNGLKQKFILELSDTNIYLAAQCIMSSEKDERLESFLKEKAEIIARNFKESDLSANGFLALSEFEDYEQILKLLSQIEKPSKIHLNVFLKILANNNSEIFFAFLKILNTLKNPQLIHYATSSFNSDIKVDSSNKEILSNTFRILFASKAYGIMNSIMLKFRLYGELEYIFGEDLDFFLKQMIYEDKIIAPNLAYHMVVGTNRLAAYPPEMFVKVLSNSGVRKDIKLALRIIRKHEIIQSKDFNLNLENRYLLLKNGRPIKTRVERLKKFMQVGLHDYLMNNVELREKVMGYINEYEKAKKTEPVSIDPAVAKSKQFIGQNEVSDFIESCLKSQMDQEDNSTAKLKLIFDRFFLEPVSFSIHSLIKELLKMMAITLKELSHYLRNYEFEGTVVVIQEYGVYIESAASKSLRRLFLHKQQISNAETDIEPITKLTIGDKINFRIIGINPETLRLNISCLDIFKPNTLE